MIGEGRVGIVEAVLKALWGTDTRCSNERVAGDRMIADAEAKVAGLQRVLDERPARNLDEAMYDMSHGRRG